MKNLFLLMGVLSISLTATANDFFCNGTGRFSQIKSGVVSLTRNSLDLIKTDKLQVSAHVDKSNSDGSHYVGIDIIDLTADVNSRFRSFKGSIYDMAMYSEGSSPATLSFIQCVPFETPTR